MILRPNGIDVFYIDESHDRSLYAVTAIAIPFLRNIDGVWRIVWPDHLASAKEWRRRIADVHKIPMSKELHATKLVSGRGNFIVGKRQLKRENAAEVYRAILADIDFIPDDSIITVVGTRGPQMFGHERLERVMYGLFQRMRSQCNARRVNAMVFFDQGHPEYRQLYRRAMVNLPTGSRFDVAPRNLPLDMFVKDGNEKNSKFCNFIQIADLIAYAALSKLRHQRGEMEPEQTRFELHTLYDALPRGARNKRATREQDSIVRLG